MASATRRHQLSTTSAVLFSYQSVQHSSVKSTDHVASLVYMRELGTLHITRRHISARATVNDALFTNDAHLFYAYVRSASFFDGI